MGTHFRNQVLDETQHLLAPTGTGSGLRMFLYVLDAVRYDVVRLLQRYSRCFPAEAHVDEHPDIVWIDILLAVHAFSQFFLFPGKIRVILMTDVKHV